MVSVQDTTRGKKFINNYVYTRWIYIKYGFFLRKLVNFRRMIKSALFKLCSIACYTFFVNTTPTKNFPFYCEPFIESFFHIFVRSKAQFSKCVTYRSKHVVIGRSQVWWVSRKGVEHSWWVLPTCREPVSPYACSVVMKKNDFVLPLLVFWTFFKQETVKIGQLLLETININRFLRF